MYADVAIPEDSSTCQHRGRTSVSCSASLSASGSASGSGNRPDRSSGAPLRWALAASLLVHAGIGVWFANGGTRGEEAPTPSISLELTLGLAPDAERDLKQESGHELAPQPPESRPVPAIAGAEVTELIAAPPVEPLTPTAEGSAEELPSVSAAQSIGRRLPLDLSPPAAPTEARGGAAATGVFDPRFDAAIRSARAATSAAEPRFAMPRVEADAGDGRVRIETEQGCYERVSDPFDDLPGDAWSLVGCLPVGDAIDWGERFRRAP